MSLSEMEEKEVSGREGGIEKRNENERARRERERKHNFSDIKSSIWCRFVKIFL